MIQAEANLGNRNNIVDRHPILEAYPRLNAFTRAVGTLMGRAMNGGDRIIRNLANTFDLENRQGGTRLIDLYNEQFRRLNQRGIDILHEEALTMNDAVDEQRREQRRNEIMQNAGEVPGIIKTLAQPFEQSNANFDDPSIDTSTKFFGNARTESIVVERDNNTQNLDIRIGKTRMALNNTVYQTENIFSITALTRKESDTHNGIEVEYDAEVDFSYDSRNININTPKLRIVGNSSKGFKIEGLNNDPFSMLLIPEISQIGTMLDEMYTIRHKLNKMEINLASDPKDPANYNYEGKDGFKFNSSEL